MRGLMIGLCAFLLVGCGPMMTPMSVKLDEKDQKRYDEFWEKAVKPPDRLTRQELLDAIAVTSAFQVGVDRMTFRSEKWYSRGVVIMVIQCDRFAPANDRFEISVVDHDGKVIRYERYTRDDVEETFKVLWGTPDGRKVATTQEVRDSAEERRLRCKRLHELFPDLVPDPDKQQGHRP